MALENAKTPDVKPMGSPSGRHEKSPIDIVIADVLGGEGTGLEKGAGNKIPDPVKGGSPIGRHEKGSSTYGTGGTSQLGTNDPFADI